VVSLGNGRAIEKDRLLNDLKMRIRGINLSSDGKIFVLTENGIILKMEEKH